MSKVLSCLVCCLTHSGSQCCALFSLPGVIFMSLMGGLVTWQVQYIHGFYTACKPRNSFCTDSNEYWGSASSLPYYANKLLSSSLAFES
jgi:hypothetical protein